MQTAGSAIFLQDWAEELRASWVDFRSGGLQPPLGGEFQIALPWKRFVQRIAYEKRHCESCNSFSGRTFSRTARQSRPTNALPAGDYSDPPA